MESKIKILILEEFPLSLTDDKSAASKQILHFVPSQNTLFLVVKGLNFKCIILFLKAANNFKK